MSNKYYNGVQYTVNSNIPDLNEKRKIRKMFNGIGLVLLIAYLISEVGGNIAYYLLYAGGHQITYNDAGLWVVDSIEMLILGCSPAVCFLITFFGYHLFTRQKFKDMLTTKNITLPLVVCTCIVALFCQQLSTFINFGLNILLSTFNLEVTFFDFEISTDAATTALDLFSSIILAPIAEELFFRGIILRKSAKISQYFAIFFSAFVFGIMHGNPYQFSLGFLVGIVFGFVTIKTGSLLPAIIGHMVVNFNASISTIIDIFDENIYNQIYYPLMLIFLVCGFIALCKLNSHGQIKFPRYTDYHRNRTMPIIITSWSIIIVMVFYAIDIVKSVSFIAVPEKQEIITEGTQSAVKFLLSLFNAY